VHYPPGPASFAADLRSPELNPSPTPRGDWTRSAEFPGGLAHSGPGAAVRRPSVCAARANWRKGRDWVLALLEVLPDRPHRGRPISARPRRAPLRRTPGSSSLPGTAPAPPIICTARRNWRKGRDSNPRDPCGPNGFQDRRNRPLCHPSGVWRIACSNANQRRLRNKVEHRPCRCRAPFLLPKRRGCQGQSRIC
jgi:hypothetical protein